VNKLPSNPWPPVAAIVEEGLIKVRPNATTLAQLVEMSLAEAEGLPLEQIALLLEDVAELKASVKAYDNILFQVLDKRLSDEAATRRKSKGKDTGTVGFVVDGVKVSADLPKKVEWAQAQLREAVDIIASWGEDPDEYVSTEIKVAESKYNAWPSSIKDVFTPARTLGVGKPTYKLERAA
jgi:hypothetical protein